MGFFQHLLEDIKDAGKKVYHTATDEPPKKQDNQPQPSLFERLASALPTAARAITDPIGTVATNPTVDRKAAQTPAFLLHRAQSSPYIQTLNKGLNADPHSKEHTQAVLSASQIIGQDAPTEVPGGSSVPEAVEGVVKGAVNAGKNLLDLRHSPKPAETAAATGFDAAHAALTANPEAAKNTTEAIIKQADAEGLHLPESVANALTEHDNAHLPGVKFSSTNSLQAPLKVAAKYFGDVGATGVYKLGQGAKFEADAKEAVRPAVEEAGKLLDKAAGKNSIVRSEIQSHVFSALEDRANADKHLTSDAEKQIYEHVKTAFDWAKQQREQRGLAVLPDYASHVQVKDSLDGDSKLLSKLSKAFSTNTESKFSKTRTDSLPDDMISKNIVDILPSYLNSQIREFAYSEPIDYLKENLKNVNPVYRTNSGNQQTGEKFLGDLVGKLLAPRNVTPLERRANKLLGNTYANQLSYNPRFALTNLGQKGVTNAEVTSHALRADAKTIAKKISKDDKAGLIKEMTSGDTAFTGEGEAVTGKKAGGKFEPAAATEKSNIHDAFFKGVGQVIMDSPQYKTLKAAGVSTKEAVAKLLNDKTVVNEKSGETLRDLAVRNGNIVVNDTQVGQNAVFRPNAFKNQRAAAKFATQYLRFPVAIADNIVSRMGNIKQARELKILQGGNPADVKLVDFKRSLQALKSANDELADAVKKGHANGVDPGDVKNTKKLIDAATKEVDKHIKDASPLTRSKTLKQFGKVYGYSVAIQTIFAPPSNSPSDNAKSALPVNVPFKGESLLDTFAPSVPFIHGETKSQNVGKILNFVPGVGLVYNRGKQAVTLYQKTINGK